MTAEGEAGALADAAPSYAGRLRFGSLPSIPSAHPARRDRLLSRQRRLQHESARIGQLLESDAAPPRALAVQSGEHAAVSTLRRSPFGPNYLPRSESLPALPVRQPNGGERLSLWGNEPTQQWRHYLFRNQYGPQPAGLRKATPMRWGYPGALSRVSFEATALSDLRNTTALHSRPPLGVSLVTSPSHPALHAAFAR
jgi:hypothetical protein